ALIHDGVRLRKLLTDPVLGGAAGHQQHRRRHQNADLHHLSHRTASFVNVGQPISTNANLPGRATSKPGPVREDRWVGVATLGRYGLYLGGASLRPIEARSGRPAAPAL